MDWKNHLEKNPIQKFEKNSRKSKNEDWEYNSSHTRNEKFTIPRSAHLMELQIFHF